MPFVWASPTTYSPGAVLDGCMAHPDAPVGRPFIGEQPRARSRCVVDEGEERELVRGLDHAGVDFARLAIFGSHDGLLADGAAPGPQSLALMLVAFAAADVGFVHLYVAVEHRHFAALKRRADAVKQMPSGLIADPEIPMQLHRGDAFESGDDLVDGDRPRLVAELGTVHDGALADAEVLAAVFAAVGHCRLAARDRVALRAAIGAGRAVRPHLSLEPLLGLVVVGEQLEELGERQALAVCAAWRLVLACHIWYLPSMASIPYNPH